MSKRKPPGYWTFENVKQEASGYNTKSEFMKGSRSAYKAALRNGWLDQVCSHMPKRSTKKSSG